MKSLIPIVGLLVAAGATAEPVGFGHYAPDAAYSERVTQSLYLPMRDGVRLAIRVSRPAVAGQAVDQRLPVIWQATLSVTEPPNIGTELSGSAFRDMPSLTRYGYVVVQVARRGNGQSFGVRRGYHDVTETDDAYEVTEWLAKQPWSNGSIGVYGCSNTGDAAMHVLVARPPHLKAVFAGCFSWSKYDAMRRGGIFAQWGTGPQRTIEEDMKAEPVDGDEQKLLLRQAAEEHQKSTNLYELWKSMPYRDSWSPLVGSRFWVEGSVGSYLEPMRQSQAAVYIQGGWHDEFRDQGFVAWRNLPGSRIVIGPWLHCQNPGFTLLQEMHRFFDSNLKGAETGLQSEPRIHYFTMNAPRGTEWRSADRWPVSGTQMQRLFFAPGPTGLTATATSRPLHAQFVVKTNLSCPDSGEGPFAQPCHTPGEGVSFAGAALRQPLEVTGNPMIQLRIGTDHRDANLFAYLEDRAPDGAVTVVTEGRLKASLRATSKPPYESDTPTLWHRAYKEDEQLLEPGQPVDLQFEFMPTSYVFARGHRVQITVTGADYRERNRDPATDGTRISLMADANHPAYIDLPVPPTAK